MIIAVAILLFALLALWAWIRVFDAATSLDQLVEREDQR